MASTFEEEALCLVLERREEEAQAILERLSGSELDALARGLVALLRLVHTTQSTRAESVERAGGGH